MGKLEKILAEKKEPFHGTNFQGTKLAERVSEWRRWVRHRERPQEHGSLDDPQRKQRTFYQYNAERIEGVPNSFDPRLSDDKTSRIEAVHSQRFIFDVIPKLLAKKPEGQKKVRVLDVATGAGLWAQQVREHHFNGEVSVVSTGLSPGEARRYRKAKGLPPLHKDDFIAQSILQLNAEEEFDLIVETYGEFHYNLTRKIFDPEYLEAYLEMVVRKLNPGGIASIAEFSPKMVDIASDFEQGTVEGILSTMLQNLKDKYYLKHAALEHHDNAGGYRITIEK